MRRLVVLAAAVLSVAACAKQESATADSPAAATPSAPPTMALTAADLAGTWDAVGMPMDRDTVVVQFTMTNDSTGQKSETVFASGDRVTATSTTYEGDSLVTTAGPFKSQTRKGQQVTTRVVWRKQDGKLVGTSYSKFSSGDSAVFRLTATKKP